MLARVTERECPYYKKLILPYQRIVYSFHLHQCKPLRTPQSNKTEHQQCQAQRLAHQCTRVLQNSLQYSVTVLAEHVYNDDNIKD